MVASDAVDDGPTDAIPAENIERHAPARIKPVGGVEKPVRAVRDKVIEGNTGADGGRVDAGRDCADQGNEP